MSENREHLLKIIGDYADTLAGLKVAENTDTMQVGVALTELYESDWAEEFLEIQPIKGTNRGRPVEPNSRNRFTQFVTHMLKDAGRRPLSGMHQYRLMNGVKLARTINPIYLTQGYINSERTVRPLQWLDKNGYASRIPEVFQYAVDLAGGDPAKVQATHTTQAVKDFKESLGKATVNQALKRSAAQRKATRVLSEFQQLIEMAKGNADAAKELERVLSEFDSRLDAAGWGAEQ